ncbi:hypothetical protein Cyast_2114 [Cyanobacterium stanieri PCC 7202]|uniref:HNH endonuclease n=1 Tax=Cyanobacterium stanieri (strain ATCC 29140 / PCC 7202) TaxID=292563 RepID=K9YMG3_CYASC|nr:hypothetical protein Cyast_2114 [Cyanobacterium stanieri PCC 7202]
MARLTPKIDTLRALFAKSGNQCAFPQCEHSLINHKNQFVAQVCHIEAALEGGERYNPHSDDEYRRSYDNLLILCYAHHVETNDVEEYTAQKLREIKKEHESKFENSNFDIEQEKLEEIVNEIHKYWNEIQQLNTVNHRFSGTGLEIKIEVKKGCLDLIDDIKEKVNGIENLFRIFAESDQNLLNDLEKFLKKKNIDISIFDDIQYYENPFIDRNWEEHTLGSTNWIKTLRIDLAHLEVKYLEEKIKINNSELLKERLKKVQKILKKHAANEIYID